MLRAACERWGFWAPGQDGRTGYGGVSMLSHSNGSVHHAWVLKDAPEMVRRTCFVDPVVFCLWEGGEFARRRRVVESSLALTELALCAWTIAIL